MNFLKCSLLILVILPVLNACGGSANKSAYYQAYQQSLEDTEAFAVNDNTVKAFGEIFANLQNDTLPGILDAVYAERFYFNDTFRTIRDKPALTHYLQQTGETVDSINVTINDVARSNNDVYVRWSMNMQFSVFGKAISSDSVGITHLRFNEEGEIILHQDFWDGADAFYQHLPVIGLWLRQIRSQL
ncbi:MAG: nuclear transport factor 2 family protein [Methylophaga sp.]|nr:nuclear transport factor 2 family protein [Methylophaga sp.]